MLILCSLFINLCQYHRQTDIHTDKHIKSTVRNLTKKLEIYKNYFVCEENLFILFHFNFVYQLIFC